VERFNLESGDLERERAEPEGWTWRATGVGERLGASMIGATLYELPPGGRSFPYHYEYGCEEWLLVVAGRPTLRHPEGEDVLEPGDVVGFPEGPEGAHKVTNTFPETARVLILSDMRKPNIAVYPDSDKVGAFPGNDGDTVMFRRGTAVDYFDGEL
jgi:uncharacterized cupin superfamily protein